MGMFARFFGKTPYNQAKRQEALTDRASQNSDGTWSLVSQCPGSGNDCGVYQKENSYELADLLKLFLIEENSRGDTQMWTVGAQKAPDNYIVWKTYGVEEERNKFHGHRYGRHGEAPVLVEGRGVPFLAEYIEEKPIVFHVDLCGDTVLGADFAVFSTDISPAMLNQAVLNRSGHFDLAQYLSGHGYHCFIQEKRGDDIFYRIETPQMREAYVSYLFLGEEETKHPLVLKLYFAYSPHDIY